MEAKTCTQCHELKTLDFFAKQKGGKFGYKAACKKCALNYWRSYREANREAIRESHRKYNRANAEQSKLWIKAWKEENKQKVNEYAKNYREANRETIRKKDRKYGKENREQKRNRDHLRRARLAGAGYFLVTKKDIARIMRQECLYCGGQAEHIDHVVPVARGGGHRIGNLAPACSSCNLRKGSKFISEWRFACGVN